MLGNLQSWPVGGDVGDIAGSRGYGSRGLRDWTDGGG